MSNYDNESQKKKYIDFLKKIENFKFDFVGLSFIQDHTTIRLLRKKFPNKLFISKIENNLGYKNRVEFIEYYLKEKIEKGKVGLVVIDGIADLCSDVNSMEQSNFVAQKLMEWSQKFNCHIITVPPVIIEKIENFGKTFDQLTIETVKAFLVDSKKANFKI